MLRKLATLITLAASLSAAAETMDINGKEYEYTVLQQRMVGPGTQWTRLRIPAYPLNVNIVTADLSNPYARVETVQGKDAIGSTEALTSMAQRYTTPGHKPLAGANGNFWCVSGQAPWSDLLIGTTFGGNVRNGVIITETNNASDQWCGTPLQTCVIAADPDRLWIEPLVWRGYLVHEKIGYVDVQQVNKVVRDGEVGLYNKYYPAGKQFQPVAYVDGHFKIEEGVSTEVYLKLDEGQTWNVGGDMTATVTKVNPNAGRGTLGDNDLCLVARGQYRESFATLTPGDKVTFNNSWTSFKTWEQPKIENLMQGLSLVLSEGEIDPATNAGNSYNNQIYPKTGYGESQDHKTLYIITIDKSTDPVYGASAGCPSDVMCSILKHFGCWNAATVDAGGSTEMFVLDRIVNRTTEGNPRPVANGWMVFSTAPSDDNEIASIAFDDYTLRAPVYSSFTPRILGYNKYGDLIDDDVKGFTLSCEESLGTCADSQFTASATPGTGVLTATYGDAKVTKNITLFDADFGMLVPEVVLNVGEQYTMEPFVEDQGYTYAYDPAGLDWVVDDAAIARHVGDGCFEGVAEGKVAVSASAGAKTAQAIISCEPASGTLPVDYKNTEVADWKVTKTSLSTATATATDNCGASLDFKISSTRGPKMTIARDLRIWSTPTHIQVDINPGTTPISSVIVTLRGANTTANASVTLTPELIASQTNTLLIPIEEFGADHQGFFPATFKSLAITPSGATGTYHVDVEGIYARHDDTNSVIDTLAPTLGTPTQAEAWYTLQGFRLTTRPTTPGLYLHRIGTHTTKELIR